MFKQLFGFPLERRPGGWSHWRVRWVSLVVWTCLLNAAIFALVVYFHPADDPIENPLVREPSPQTENRGAGTSTDKQ